MGDLHGCGVDRVAMQDYGSFVPDALKSSQDSSLHQLGTNLDLFPYVYLNYEVGFSWVTNRTHSLVETRSYLAYLVALHNISRGTYVMKETVREMPRLKSIDGIHWCPAFSFFNAVIKDFFCKVLRVVICLLKYLCP